MANQLTADEVERILETYSETEDVGETAEKLSHSEKTVRKYRDQAIEEGDTRMPEVPSDYEPEEDDDPASEHPGDSPFGAETPHNLAEDFSGVTPGEFIKAFFKEFEVGLKGTWIAIQARRADRRGLLPTKRSMMKDILNMKSGIAQSAIKEAEYIAEEYWAEAQRFLRQTGYEVEGTPLSDTGRVGAGMGVQGAAGAAAGFGQEYVGAGGQAAHAAGGGEMPTIQSLQQQLNQIQRQLNQGQPAGGSANGGGSPLGRLQELKQEKEILEELSEGDERLAAIEQQINALRQQALQGGGGGGAMPASQADDLEDRLLAMAQQDPDVSLREVMSIIEERQEQRTDPELLKTEKEMEIEEKKMEHSMERTERIAETLGDLADRVGEGIGKKLMETDTEPEPAPVQDQGGQDRHEVIADGASEAAPPTQADAAEADIPDPAMMGGMQTDDECPHCGTYLVQQQGGILCPECQYGVGGCDICGWPVEIPPEGDSRYARCGDCETILDKEDADNGLVECEDCNWKGSVQELRGEALRCDGCDELRPIQRQPDREAAEEKLQEIMGD